MNLFNIAVCMLPMLAFQILLWYTTKQSRPSLHHELTLLLFSFAIITILTITGISPMSGFHLDIRWQEANFTPFHGIGQMLNNGFWGIVVNLGGNIALFFPFGFLLPLLWPKNGLIRTVLQGMLLSAVIEGLQLFLLRSTDIDDLLLNTMGTLLGYIAYRIFRYYAPRVVVRVAAENGSFLLPWAYIGLGLLSVISIGLFEMQRFGLLRF